jgi:hypothetical protein
LAAGALSAGPRQVHRLFQGELHFNMAYHMLAKLLANTSYVPSSAVDFFNSIHCRMGVDIMQTAAIAVINEILVISGPRVKTNLRVVICLSKLD